MSADPESCLCGAVHGRLDRSQRSSRLRRTLDTRLALRRGCSDLADAVFANARTPGSHLSMKTLTMIITGPCAVRQPNTNGAGRRRSLAWATGRGHL